MRPGHLGRRKRPPKGVAYFKEITGDYHLVGLDDAVIEAYIGGAKENADWLLDEFEIETKTHNACEYPLRKPLRRWAIPTRSFRPKGWVTLGSGRLCSRW